MRFVPFVLVTASLGVIGARRSAPVIAMPVAAQAASHGTSVISDRTTWDSVFTPEQATRGEAAYAATCSRCHQESLGGADQAPALAGGTFLSKWSGLTLGELHDRVRITMPPGEPGTYGRQHISDVLAYMLSVNGFPAGRTELPVAAEALHTIRIEATRR